MVTASGPMPLGQLLSKSYAQFLANWKPVVVCAVIIGALMAGAQLSLASQVQRNTAGYMQNLGLDQQKIQDLSARMRNGDQKAADELQAMMKNSGMTDQAAMQNGMHLFASIAPFMGVAFLVTLVLSWVAVLWYFLIALGQIKENDMQSGVQKIGKKFFPMFGLWIWMALRSFVWIPFIGIITGIIIMPRLSAAPLLLLRDNKGIMESTRISYMATSGYWGKIIGNGFVLGLIMLGIFIVVGIVSGILGFISPILSTVLLMIAKQVATGYAVMFSVALSQTILEHPVQFGKA